MRGWGGAHCRCRVSCQFVFDMPLGPTQITTNKWQLTATSARQRNVPPSLCIPSPLSHYSSLLLSPAWQLNPPLCGSMRLPILGVLSSLNVHVKTLYLSYLFMFMSCPAHPPPPFSSSPSPYAPTSCAKLGIRPLAIGHRLGHLRSPTAAAAAAAAVPNLFHWTCLPLPPPSPFWRLLTAPLNPQSKIYFVLKHIKILQIAGIK